MIPPVGFDEAESQPAVAAPHVRWSGAARLCSGCLRFTRDTSQARIKGAFKSPGHRTDAAADLPCAEHLEGETRTGGHAWGRRLRTGQSRGGGPLGGVAETPVGAVLGPFTANARYSSSSSQIRVFFTRGALAGAAGPPGIWLSGSLPSRNSRRAATSTRTNPAGTASHHCKA